jgi:CRP-like cAMP-binding protein
MPSPTRKPSGNRLLDCLPDEELEELQQRLETITLKPAQEICHEDSPLSHVYFPVSGVYAMVVPLEDGRLIEVSTVGNEGIIGIAAALGLEYHAKTTTTPVPGNCLRLEASALRAALKPNSGLDQILRRYVAYALRNAYQTVACNAVHSAKERMCRWLLTSHDRLGGGDLTMTHEVVAQLLGIRRQTVTSILGALQAAGCLASRRGVIRVLNRKALEGQCCECYHVTRSLYEQIVQCSAPMS